MSTSNQQMSGFQCWHNVKISNSCQAQDVYFPRISSVIYTVDRGLQSETGNCSQGIHATLNVMSFLNFKILLLIMILHILAKIWGFIFFKVDLHYQQWWFSWFRINLEILMLLQHWCNAGVSRLIWITYKGPLQTGFTTVKWMVEKIVSILAACWPTPLIWP